MTQEQVSVLKQSERILHSKLEILDNNMQIIRELTGFLIGGDYDIKAKTGVRRSCDFQFIVDEDTIPSPTSPIWINKKIRCYVGITNLLTDEVVWFPIGTFAISDPSQDVSLAENTLKVKGIDFFGFMDGTLGGSLGNKVIVNCGDKVDNAILNTIKEFTNFNTNISESKYTIPYKIEKDAHDDLGDLLKEMIELYMNYEGFFDVWGTFIFQETSNLINDAVVWDFSIPENNLITSASIEYQWDEVRNRITVTGKEKDGTYPKYTAVALSTNKGWEDCPYTIDVMGETKALEYKLPLPLIDKVWANVQSATDKDPELLHIKELAQQNQWDKTTALENTFGDEIRMYLVGIMPLSELKAKFTNYKISDEFDKFISDQSISDYAYNPRAITINDSKYFKQAQCITKAQYELDRRLSGSEKIRLSTVPIYGLDVNQLIYLDMMIEDTHVIGKYCVDDIACKLGEKGEMTINCHKVTQPRYNFNPEILNERDSGGWQYPARITVDKNGQVGTEGGDLVINNIMDSALVNKYRMDIPEQKDINDMIGLTKGNDFNIKIEKTKDDAKMLFCGEELERSFDDNWKTKTYSIGKNLLWDEGWLGTNDTGLPSYWKDHNPVVELDPRDAAKMDTYLPSFIINKFKMSEVEAKEMCWVGICYSKRTDTANNFDRKKRKPYVKARLEKTGGILEISETYGQYTPLNKDVNGNWYTAKYLYGQNIFVDKGWIGDKPTGKTMYPFNEEKNGFLRIDYDEVISGKKSILD